MITLSDPAQRKKLFIVLGAALFVLLLSYGIVSIVKLRKNNAALAEDIARLHSSLQASETTLEEMTASNVNLETALKAERQKALSLEGQVGTLSGAVAQITGTVQTLDKLARTDQELLMKYSKVFFLNEHYTPIELVRIPEAYVQNGDEEYIHSRVFPYLENLIKAAKADGQDLRVVSGYRSFETQRDLKSQYRVTYGTGANRFSADQGYSEHQLGTTVDFTSAKLGASFKDFEAASEYEWLKQNAHRFGFILSYPKNNKYYIFEPWHWRYVGVALATKLHTEGKYFYDMDQRDIDKYLASVFD